MLVIPSTIKFTYAFFRIIHTSAIAMNWYSDKTSKGQTLSLISAGVLLERTATQRKSKTANGLVSETLPHC